MRCVRSWEQVVRRAPLEKKKKRDMKAKPKIQMRKASEVRRFVCFVGRYHDKPSTGGRYSHVRSCSAQNLAYPWFDCFGMATARRFKSEDRSRAANFSTSTARDCLGGLVFSPLHADKDNSHQKDYLGRCSRLCNLVQTKKQ